MRFRFFIKGIIAIFPSFLKRFFYRHLFGYKIGKRVRIGLSIIDVDNCVIEDDTSIGHFNIFIGTKSVSVGDHTIIGHFNVFRGGDLISIGRYCEILRFNEINSLSKTTMINEVDQTFIIGDGTMLGASHKIDFTDRVEVGKCVILGGRNSSVWTHNRQMTKPVSIGDYAYIGSEIRIAPGGEIPANSIVGIGSVITKKLEGEYKVIAGVPARVISDLDEAGIFLISNKTRPDLPDEIANAPLGDTDSKRLLR